MNTIIVVFEYWCSVCAPSVLFRTMFTRVFSTISGELCYCCDIPALFIKFGIEHIAHDWRLSINGSKSSIKAVLHNGNVHPSVAVAYSVTMRETYQKLEEVLYCIQYVDH